MAGAEPFSSSGPGGLVGSRVGRFHICALLGAGGMGEVYRAEDTKLKRTVALKRVSDKVGRDPRCRQQILKEAQRACALNSHHIASIYDVVEEDAEVFLVMEYVEGVTLRDRLRRPAPISLDQFLDLATQSAEALTAAHQKGILHRDIKPENIMITPAAQVKILDFGLAKRLPVVDETSPTVSLDTSQVGAAGTPGYMAPEVLLGQEADYRSDIFSLGVVFYEMIVGKHPFRGKKSTGEADAISLAPPTLGELFPCMPAELDRIIQKMLSRDPDQRYATAADMLVDLRALRRATSPAVMSRPASRVDRRLRRVLYLVLPALALLLALLLTHPWRQLAAEHRTSVLVADFEDRTGTPGFDQILSELLTTTLEQSPRFAVFPSNRRPDVLTRMELKPDLRVDERLGREIALREGLQAVLVGSISRLGERFILLVRAVSPEGKTLVSTQQVANDAQSLPAALDSIARKLRTGLGESLTSVDKTSLPLAQVTSTSLEALRYFSLGKQRLYSDDPKEATGFFRQAIEIDSSFAMAHEYLGIAYWRMDDEVRARAYLEKAARLVNRVTEPERHKILGDYASLIRDYDAAIEHFQILVQLRPDDVAAHMNLGANYAAKFQYDQAIAETAAAVRLQPDAGPRGNLAYAYFVKGDTERALALVQELMRGNPSNLRGQQTLARCFLSLGREEDARKLLLESFGSNAESAARTLLADLALAHGSYGEAAALLKPGVDIDEGLGNLSAARNKRVLWAEIAVMQGSSQQLDRILSGNRTMWGDPMLLALAGRLYARGGRVAEARRRLGRLQALMVSQPSPTLHSLASLLSADIALAEHRTQAAVEASEQAVHFENSVLAVETLAHALRVAGRNSDAIREYEKVLARGNERIDAYDGPAFHQIVLDHYWLGVAQQEIGDTPAARRHLEIFLHHWRQPDGTPEFYRDAKRRLNVMGAVPPPAAGNPTPAT